MFNKKNMHRFIKTIYHLYVEQGILLTECLDIMGKSAGKTRVKTAALYVEEELRQGNMLSNALKTCPAISFDNTTVTFVDFSEKTGSLGETLSFLKERCERKEKAGSAIAEAAVYPCFVIFLSIFVSALMIFYADSVLQESFMKGSLLKSLFADFCFLLLFCALSFLFLRRSLGDDPLYEAFLSVGFLIKHGVNASLAVGLGANILGLDSRYGQIFLRARLRLEDGKSLVQAFCGNEKEGGFRDKEILEAFYYAQKSGGKNDVFERISARLGKKIERKNALLLSLVEPLFTGGTGLYLIVLMGNFLMPVMNSLNLM